MVISDPVVRARPVGFVCIVASAAGFGAMPIFAKLAYAESVDLPSMLFLRFALAGLMMAVLMRVRGMVWPRGRNLLLLVAMGGSGLCRSVVLLLRRPAVCDGRTDRTAALSLSGDRHRTVGAAGAPALVAAAPVGSGGGACSVPVWPSAAASPAVSWALSSGWLRR
jgi:drug/metabolite transporter (DMT)-like permease